MGTNSFQDQRSEPGAERFSARSPRESEVGRPQLAVPWVTAVLSPTGRGRPRRCPSRRGRGCSAGPGSPLLVSRAVRAPRALREGSAGATVPPHPARSSADPRPGPPQRDGAGAAGPGALDNLGRVCRDQAAAAGGGAEGRLGVGTEREQPPPGAGRVRRRGHTGTAAGAAAGAAGPLGRGCGAPGLLRQPEIHSFLRGSGGE